LEVSRRRIPKKFTNGREDIGVTDIIFYPALFESRARNDQGYPES
jgi:hypothetical protein